MIYVRTPTDPELQELRRMTRQEIGRVGQRAQMILLSAQKRTVPEVAIIFGCQPKTVRKWMRRFDANGPASLYDEPRSGRPLKLTDQVRDTLVNMIQQDPAHSGHLATFWTVALLAVALAERLGVYLSHSSLRQALHATELAWSRPRLAMPVTTDQEKTTKSGPSPRRSSKPGRRRPCCTLTNRASSCCRWSADVALAGPANPHVNTGQQPDPQPVRSAQHPYRPVDLPGA